MKAARVGDLVKLDEMIKTVKAVAGGKVVRSPAPNTFTAPPAAAASVPAVLRQSDAPGTPRAPQPPEEEEVIEEVKIEGELTFGHVEQYWDNLCARVKKRSMSIAALLKEAKPLTLEESTVVVGFDLSSIFHKERIEEPARRRILDEEVRKIFGEGVKTRIASINEGEAPDELAHPESRKAPESESKVREQVLEEPMVQKILQSFDGQIINIL